MYKALRISHATYPVYRNMAALALLVVLPPDRVIGDVMIVQSKTSNCRWQTKNISNFSLLTRCQFDRNFIFVGVQDQMVFTQIKMSKFGRETMKLRKARQTKRSKK